MSPGTAKARAFLAAFRMCGNITKAAEAAGVEKTMHYRWLRNPAYARDFDQAQLVFGDVLEAEAIRRANEGVFEPVFYQGKPCGAIRKFSDGLMVHLLKRFKPEKYASRITAELAGPGGGPIMISDAVKALTNDELANAIALADKLAAGGDDAAFEARGAARTEEDQEPPAD